MEPTRNPPLILFTGSRGFAYLGSPRFTGVSSCTPCIQKQHLMRVGCFLCNLDVRLVIRGTLTTFPTLTDNWLKLAQSLPRSPPLKKTQHSNIAMAIQRSVLVLASLLFVADAFTGFLKNTVKDQKSCPTTRFPCLERCQTMHQDCSTELDNCDAAAAQNGGGSANCQVAACLKNCGCSHTGTQGCNRNCLTSYSDAESVALIKCVARNTPWIYAECQQTSPTPVFCPSSTR